MTALPINELFETICGEAHWTGTPATFVRLQSCPIGCPWCDTKHTWTLNSPDQISVDEMIRKTLDAPTFAQVEVNDLVELIEKNQSQHVVLTGGEPAMYDLRDLTTALWNADFRVQLETSGTFEIKVTPHTWVTVSPKINMPGGYAVRPDTIARADEIKMPVGKMDDIFKLHEVLKMRAGHGGKYEVWLQPLSTSPKATALCIEQARINNWRVSLQTHKFAGLR